MPESTVRKSRVSFRIVGSGEFVVEHEDAESPADVLKELVAEKRLGLVDLYLHGDEFEWKLEATDDLSYPPELGGGNITEADKALICECGRAFVHPDIACPCGRTSEQFERPPEELAQEARRALRKHEAEHGCVESLPVFGLTDRHVVEWYLAQKEDR